MGSDSCIGRTFSIFIYFSIQSQQSSSNVVVVNSQPQAVVAVTHTSPDAGLAALIFAIVITFLAFFFCCWWSVICSFMGIGFAVGVSIFFGLQYFQFSHNSLFSSH